MAAASHRNDKILLARETDRGDDVIHSGAPRDQGRALVRHRIPDDACLIVFRVVGPDDLSGEPVEGDRHYLSLLVSPIAAWAAARRATGTRNGLHET